MVPGASFHPPQGQITLQAPMYDNILRVLPANEATVARVFIGG